MKVIITRPRAQADEFVNKLHAAGFEPVYFPVIEIRPLENNTELEAALKNITKYAWIVFTSANAVDVFFQHLEATHLVRPKSLGGPGGSPLPQVAAVGPKTAAALRKHNIEPNFIPDKYVGEAIMSGLGDVKDKWILLPRAEIARKELPEAIAQAGGIAHEITVYQTLPAAIDLTGLGALKTGVDAITFTSASTVENFAALMRQNKLDPLNLPNNPLFACIGPITGQAARQEGFTNLIIAEEYTTDGLIKALSNPGVHHA